MFQWFQSHQKNYSGDSYSAYYGMVNNISVRIHLMEELNCSKEEIREYREKYRNFSEIRKMEIINIYEKRNMQKEYAEELRYQVFECVQRNLEYITKLKKLCSETEWKGLREQFLENKTSYCIRYDFLLEEGLFERLLMEIRKANSAYVLDRYERVLRKHLPNDVRDTYIQYVKNEAARVSDRKAYKHLTSYLKKITEYPERKRLAQEIADCWKRDYRRRPAMMDEIKKAGF